MSSIYKHRIKLLKGRISYTAIIPKEILKTFGFQDEDELILEVNSNGLALKKDND